MISNIIFYGNNKKNPVSSLHDYSKLFFINDHLEKCLNLFGSIAIFIFLIVKLGKKLYQISLIYK